MLKKLPILLGIFFLLVTGFALAEEPVTILLNGEPLVTDVPAEKVPVYDKNNNYQGDRVLIPLRAVGEAMNCDVYWNEATEGITIYRNNQLAMMWIGKEYGFLLNGLSLGNAYPMEVPPTLKDGRTLVPVRATTELLGATVSWEDATNTVSISYEIGELEENEGVAESCQVYSLFMMEYYEEYAKYCQGTLLPVKGVIELTDGRRLHFELYPQLAPKTCERFIECAENGFYDNTIFHRVIDGFVAQGGGFERNMKPKDLSEITPLPGEFILNGFFNILPHERGSLSFARATDPNSGGTQFFIVQQDSPSLDGYYATFGRITSGMGAIDNICQMETDENDAPVTPVVIKTITILNK